MYSSNMWRETVLYSEVQLKIRNVQQPSAQFLSTQTSYLNHHIVRFYCSCL